MGQEIITGYNLHKLETTTSELLTIRVYNYIKFNWTLYNNETLMRGLYM